MYIKVTVSAGSKKEKIEEKGDRLSLFVKHPAERGLANDRVRELLAERFGVLKSQVRLVSGHQKPSKIFDIIDSDS